MNIKGALNEPQNNRKEDHKANMVSPSLVQGGKASLCLWGKGMV